MSTASYALCGIRINTRVKPGHSSSGLVGNYEGG